jgi:hypothetical protein
VNVAGVTFACLSFDTGTNAVRDSLKRSGLRCQAYRSSVHRRRYSAFVAGDGRGGKLDLGSRSVDDHDARSTRVGASIIASWAGWWADDAVVGCSDILGP